MPKISLWKNYKDNDYYFADRVIREYFNQGATGVHVHKYIGPKGSEGDITEIGDVLFLENRDRSYDPDIYELRGAYNPQDSDFDLSQFGIFLSSDTIFISFHYTAMLDIYGRKLMAGDVLELPHLRDPDTLDEDDPATNRSYAIEDASHSANGYGPRWWSHIWRVKAKQLRESPEFSEIVGNGLAEDLVDENGDYIGTAGCEDDLKNTQSTYCKDLEITDGIVKEAEENVKFDPKWFDTSHLWVIECDGEYQLYWQSGDGIPPNGSPLIGAGDEFPSGMLDGEFFLRTDYTPDRLFKKEGSVFRKVEDDMRKKWTGYNRIQDTYIDNTETDTMQDGKEIRVKQPLSKAVRPKVDHHQDKLDDIKKGDS